MCGVLTLPVRSAHSTHTPHILHTRWITRGARKGRRGVHHALRPAPCPWICPSSVASRFASSRESPSRISRQVYFRTVSSMEECPLGLGVEVSGGPAELGPMRGLYSADLNPGAREEPLRAHTPLLD